MEASNKRFHSDTKECGCTKKARELIFSFLRLTTSSCVECMITANIPTLQGGAWNAMTMARGQRISEIAWINRLPHIQLVQSVKKTPRDPPPPTQIANITQKELVH